MKLRLALFIGTSAALSLSAADKEEKITFEDHILPIFENKCLNCHNPDEAKGGLDLSTYGAMLNGGSGGKVIEPEDPASSRIYSLMAHTEEPYMPPRKPKAPDAELAVIAKWINGGILETSNSKAKKSDKPKMDMTLITASGKPDGPAAMPEHVILQPELVTERPNAVPALAHSPWAPIVAVAGQKQVILYHSEDFDVLGILPYPEGFPQSLSFSSSGAILQAGGGRGGKSGNVVAWDVKTGERIFEVGREFDIVLGSDISPDHRNVVMGGPGKIFKIWDTVSGEQITAVKKHPDWMLTADYSPDGVLLATGGRNSGLYVWEGATGLEFYTLKGHTAAVTNVGWRPDSNILGSISEDGQAMLWEMNEGKQIKKWTAHSGGGLAIDFSPDGLMIATAGRDKTVKLWKVDGAALRTIKASDDIVMSVAFTNDSKRVISGDYNGVIKVWNVADGAELGELDANPPTIDKQIEYAEKRISELRSKIPTLEKSIAAAQAEAAKAKSQLAEVAKKAGELGSKKAAMDKEIASLGGKLKSLSDEKTKVQGAVTQNTSLMQKRLAERVKAEKELQQAKTEFETARKNVEKYNQILKDAAAAANQTKQIAESPVFKDPNQQKAYLAAQAAISKALNDKKAADANALNRKKAADDLNNKLAAQVKLLNDLNQKLTSAKSSLDKAQAAAKASTEKRKKVDVAFADARPASPELAKSQQEAVKEEAIAHSEAKATNDAYSQLLAIVKKQEAAVATAQNAAKGPVAQFQAAQNDQKAKNTAYQKAVDALKPFQEAGGAQFKAIAQAKADLPAKVAAYKKADADQRHHENIFKGLTTKVAQLDGKLKSAKAAEQAAMGDMNEANTMLAEKAKALSETGAKLNQTKAEINKIQAALDAALKQKEAQAKAVTAVASKESTVKKSVEMAKADLEQSNFLARKFKAAAINFEAKVESEELDDMANNLDGMLDEETEAKEEHKVATEARLAAEKTLAEAKQTVAEGTKKLKDTTSTVLERALALIASRTAADLREEVAEEPEKPLVVAALDSESISAEPQILPEEVEDKVETVGLVSTVLAEQSPEQINAEIEAIEKRLKELSSSIAQAYTEADKTKETVVKASDVAAKTPPVIAERTKVEKSKAEVAQSIEQQRKEQEATVEKQKKLIDELKKKYLESLPERK